MKKKLLTVLFALTALVVLSTSAFAMQDVDYLNNDANLRSGPSTSYGVVCVLPSGLQVYLDSFNSDNSWVNIIYTDPSGNSVAGWTWAGNLSNYGAAYRNGSSSTYSAPTSYSHGTMYVNATHLNLRTAPDTNSQVYTTMPNGTAVTVLNDLGNGWDYVAWGNYEGYCSNAYLTSNRAAVTVPSYSSNNPVTGSNLPLIGQIGSNSHGAYTVKGTAYDTPMYAGESTDELMVNIPGNQYVECYSIDASGYAYCGYNGYYGFIPTQALIG